MQAIIQQHVSAIETAILDAEDAAAGLPDGEVKTAAQNVLSTLHSAAHAQLQIFLTTCPSEVTEGVALRSGGTDKDGAVEEPIAEGDGSDA